MLQGPHVTKMQDASPGGTPGWPLSCVRQVPGCARHRRQQRPGIGLHLSGGHGPPTSRCHW
eukprot:1672666-Alexandrium_andersonii.AAC.1